MRLRIPVLAVLFALVASIGAIGCSSDDDDDAGENATDDASSTTTTAPLPNQEPPLSANGIKIDDDGDLWIASLNGGEILRVDPESGEILTRLVMPVGSGPDDLVFGADGTIYWTGFTSGDVASVNPAHGSVPELLGNVGPGANPIALRDDGMLIVGRAVTGSGLYVVDPSGEREPELLGDPGNLNSFDIAPDGTLYAPSSATGEAVALDADTGQVVEAVAPIPGIPVALRWHDDQLFVLTIEGTSKVYRVDLADRSVELFADTGLAAADNLAVSDDGEVFVTGFQEPIVAVFDADGESVRTLDIGTS
jgi:sugar lactone lactonase YvrE